MSDNRTHTNRITFRRADGTEATATWTIWTTSDRARHALACRWDTLMAAGHTPVCASSDVDDTRFAKLREAFPDFDLATLPAIRAEWVDTSWRNDACPSFQATGFGDIELEVYVDYQDPVLRECTDSRRFAVLWRADDGTTRSVIYSNDWADVLLAVDGFVAPAPRAFGLGDRVRLSRDVSVWPTGEFPKGATGTVCWVPSARKDCEAIAHVRFDRHFPALDEWLNALHVHAPDDGEITWADFEDAGPDLTATARQMGAVFLALLHNELGQDDVRAVVLANRGDPRTVDGTVCHSHDHCDANVLMAEAFDAVTGREPFVPVDAEAGDATEAQVEDDCLLMNAAWSFAMADMRSDVWFAQAFGEDIADAMPAPPPAPSPLAALVDLLALFEGIDGGEHDADPVIARARAAIAQARGAA